MRLTLTPELKARFARYYEKNGAWGSLHIVLDDGNLADDQVRSCEGWAEERGDFEGMELAKILLQMTKTQRAKIGMEAGCWLRDLRTAV